MHFQQLFDNQIIFNVQKILRELGNIWSQSHTYID